MAVTDLISRWMQLWWLCVHTVTTVLSSQNQGRSQVSWSDVWQGSWRPGAEKDNSYLLLFWGLMAVVGSGMYRGKILSWFIQGLGQGGLSPSSSTALSSSPTDHCGTCCSHRTPNCKFMNSLKKLEGGKGESFLFFLLFGKGANKGCFLVVFCVAPWEPRAVSHSWSTLQVLYPQERDFLTWTASGACGG